MKRPPSALQSLVNEGVTVTSPIGIVKLNFPSKKPFSSKTLTLLPFTLTEAPLYRYPFVVLVVMATVEPTFAELGPVTDPPVADFFVML